MREFLYNSVIECVIKIKLVILTKIWLNETHNRVYVGKHLFVLYSIRDSLKIVEVSLPLLFSFALEYAYKSFQIIQDDWN